MTSRTWRLGTRRSPLALAQAELVAHALRASGLDVELVPVVTMGDSSSASLSTIGGAGVFVTALRDALRAGRVEVAVHSLKDLPTAFADGLRLAAIPARDDARDVLVARDGRSLDDLPANPRVGTGSPRRAAQLHELRCDVQVVDVRGNVDTRLRLVRDGDLDAVVLAAAGLRRIGRIDEATQIFDPAVMVPAPGQGALAVEIREPLGPAEHDLVTALAALDDPATRAEVTAERAVLAALEAGCTAPVGAFAHVGPASASQPAHLHLSAYVAASGAGTAVRTSVTAPVDEAQRAGIQLAQRVLQSGHALLEVEPAS